MATFLLFIIYIAFIGLGIPDSLFGTAWPAIYTEFDIPLSYASFVTVIISCGTVISSIFSAKIINRLGTNKVSAISTAMTAVALLGFSFSGNLFYLCLCAIPLGLGAGAIDTALNNYVAIHYSATHMSFLHCFYGIGVSISPYILSLVINGKFGWRGGYRIASIIQICIALILLFSLPIWKKIHSRKNDDENSTKALTLKETIKIPGVKIMCCLFITTCAIEFTCGGWGSTFLVEYKHMAADQAAKMVMFYYIGIALGRFLSGIFAIRFNSWQIITMGQCILGAAIVFLLLPLYSAFSALGLFLVGLGNGPLFPNFNFLTPQNFGEDISQSVMGTQMASSYIGTMIAPTVCGILGQFINMGIFPLYLLIFYLIMIAATRKVKYIFIMHRK